MPIAHKLVVPLILLAAAAVGIGGCVSTTGSDVDAAQGVRGRVLLPDGSPAAAVPVLVMDSATANPIELFLVNRSGKAKPPRASTATLADGTFRVGVEAGLTFDLRIASPDHPEFHLSNIAVGEAEWLDARDITLETGTLVTGRVVDVHSKAPVPNAKVHLASSHQSHQQFPLPGRERGIPTVTNVTGSFRFTTGPRSGRIDLLAEAPGYASSEILNQPIHPDAANDYTLEVEVGQSIAGICVDATGSRVGEVRIVATGLGGKAPMQATTTSDADGQFLFGSLRRGPYQLTTSAAQFAELRLLVVLTGETEVKVVLTKRGTAHLQVLAANGQAIHSYSLSLKRSFTNNPLGIADVPEWPDRRIDPGDYRATDGTFAVVDGLPNGQFRFLLTEAQHAKTLSPPFTIREGEVVEVRASMTLGGAITGTVIDARGEPVADATVASDWNGDFPPTTTFHLGLAKRAPATLSWVTVKTDVHGRYRIPRLSVADYMVRVTHPDQCDGVVLDLLIEDEGQVVDAGVLQLARGAILEGCTTLDGKPAGKVHVKLFAPQPTADETTRGTPRAWFSAFADSDGNGRFRLNKRVPPGTYRVEAHRPMTAGDMFTPMLDAKETAREIVVAPGQEYVQVTFELKHR